MNNAKGENYINEYITTITKTEQTLSQQQLMNRISFNMPSGPQTIEHNDSIPYDQPMNNESSHHLKIANDILLKANNDLKAMNQIYQDEIAIYRNNTSFSTSFSPHHHNQSQHNKPFDNNHNIFLSNLKQALNSSQESNTQLQAIIFKTQQQYEKLTKANQDLLSSHTCLKASYSNQSNELLKLQSLIANQSLQIEQLKSSTSTQHNQILSLENQLNDKDNKISLQSTITTSQLQYKNDTEETLNQLKNTITSLQKSNMTQIDKNTSLQAQIDQLKNVIKLKEEMIGKGGNDLKHKENDSLKLKERIEELNSVIKQLKASMTVKQNEMRNLCGENERQKTKIESLSLFIEDRERTIATLKTSLGILTKTFENDLSTLRLKDDQCGSNDNCSEGLMKEREREECLSDLIQQKKMQEVKVEELEKEVNGLRSENGKYKKEIDSYSCQFEQSKYDYQLLYQKYKEQSALIEELKSDYLNKRKDDELIELIKANEEIVKKLKVIQEENKVKTNEINKLKVDYEKISQELIMSQRANASLDKSINNTQRSKGESQRNIIKDSNQSIVSLNDKNKVHYDHSDNNRLKSSGNCLFNYDINDLDDSTSTQQLDLLINHNTNPNEYRYNYANNNARNSTIGNCVFYTMINKYYILSFNIQLKTFNKLSYKDNTINNSSISFTTNYDQSISLKVNICNGLLIITNNQLYLFNAESSSLDHITQLNHSHRKGSAMYLNNSLYIISGENTKQCETVSSDSSSTHLLPSVNYSRTEAGLCFIDNTFLYAIYGHCERNNSIERLNIRSNDTLWEVMQFSYDIPNLNQSMLSHFACVANESKIIILGGINHKGINNHMIIQYDHVNGVIREVGYSKCYALFNESSIQIENNMYMNFDIEGNVHIYDKMCSFYKLIKLSLE